MPTPVMATVSRSGVTRMSRGCRAPRPAVGCPRIQGVGDAEEYQATTASPWDGHASAGGLFDSSPWANSARTQPGVAWSTPARTRARRPVPASPSANAGRVPAGHRRRRRPVPGEVEAEDLDRDQAVALCPSCARKTGPSTPPPNWCSTRDKGLDGRRQGERILELCFSVVEVGGSRVA